MKQHPQSPHVERFVERTEIRRTREALGDTVKLTCATLREYYAFNHHSVLFTEPRKKEIREWGEQNPERPKIVVFDVGGVIFPDPNGGDLVRKNIAAKALGISPDDIPTEVWDTNFLNTGLVLEHESPEVLFERFLREINVPIPKDLKGALESIMKDFTPFKRIFEEGILDILAELRRQGIITMVLSNISRAEKEVLVDPIRGLFGQEYYSYDRHKKKSNSEGGKEIFRDILPDAKHIAERSEPYKPEDVVFIDDNYAHLGDQLGMKGIKYTTGNVDALIASLKKLRLLPQGWKSYSRERTHYLASFSLRNTSAFRPHFHRGETLGRTPGKDIWRNVSEHCLVAGAFAELIAREINRNVPRKKPAFAEERVRRITHAAILHDWRKKAEIVATRGLMDGHEIKDAIEKDARKGDEILRSLGISEQVIQLSGANLVQDDHGPSRLPEMILFYVDQMLQGSEVVLIAERQRGSYEEGSRDHQWSEAHRADAHFQGKSLEEVEQDAADRVGHRLADMLRFDGPVEELPMYLQSLLEEKILTHREES